LRDVERDELEREAGRHHPVGCFRVDVHVELGGGRHVARHVDRPPHDDETPDVREGGGVQLERLGHVRQRSDRDHGQHPSDPARRLNEGTRG